MIDYN